MNHLQDLSVLVLGLGDSGLAMARWCARFGARVQVWDSRAAPPGLAALAQASPQASFFSGDFSPERITELLADVKLVLKSPGLAPGDARIAPLLDQARATGIAVAGELGLFARALADLKSDRGYAPKLLAITGTNGKTTTTAMCAQLVARCGLRVAMAGNIGPTLLDTLAQALDDEQAARDAAPVPEANDAELAEVAAAAGLPPHGAMAAVADTAAGPDDATVPADAAAHADDSPDIADTLAASPTPEVSDSAAANGANAADEAATDTPDDAPLRLPPPPPAAPVFLALPQVWVVELSSFQLDGVQGFEPSAAAVLNITQDHLDWHGDMDAYAAAKARIFGLQAVMVVNRDDVRVEAMIPPPVLVKGGRGRANRLVGRHVVRFGLDAPQRPGDFGLVTEHGMAWLVRAREVDETLARRKPTAAAAASADDDEILLQRLMPADALRVRGRHNAANALAALALACAIGCPLAPMLHGLRDYAGEPHRVAFVASVAGVEAFDDSKGTNVGATVAALDGLGADKAPAKLLVILGGDGKGQDFSPLAAPVARHARGVALIGRDAEAIAQALAPSLAGTDVQQSRHDSLPAAVAWCFAQARPGDAVLLSPACASLDMFRNYGHRAEVFVQAVHDHAADLGEALA